jgi:HAD superfamily hydrolase (TIGR01662 family)
VLFDGIEELLRSLEQRGIKWGIVTNKPALYTELLVPEIDLAHAACVISGDTTPHPKPHPAPLLEAARRMNVAPQDCWYVGDDLRDMQAGQAAKMTTIAAAWGYCGASEPVTWRAQAVASSPLELLALIPA